jgi:DNA-binding HxlR family transcriptional regulator
VEYSLSELGESMRPILNSMQVWGENYKQMMVTDANGKAEA